MHLAGCRACCNVMYWGFYGVCPEAPGELAICYSSLSLDYVCLSPEGQFYFPDFSTKV